MSLPIKEKAALNYFNAASVYHLIFKHYQELVRYTNSVH